jgi:hypothetical protein
MALIDCPECGHEVSSNAAVCPACAYPVKTATQPVSQRAVTVPPEYKWWKTALSMLLRVAVGAVIAGVGGGEEESVMAIIGGVLIGGSAIPTWYRSRIERLKAGRGVADLEYGFEDRMAEFEQRQQEQFDRLERMHTGQIADLEERVDFAERLLAKQRDQIGPG